MELTEAMSLFGLDSLTAEGISKTIKDNYRKLMKQYHPDVYREDNGDKAKKIAEAYKVLKEVTGKYSELIEKEHLKGNENINIVIGLNQLIHLYRGDKFYANLKSGRKEISKATINNFNTLILCEMSLIHCGVAREIKGISVYNKSDIYNITCYIEVTDLNNKEDIQINILNKTKTISITAQSLKLVMTLEYGIKVNVIINKRKL